MAGTIRDDAGRPRRVLTTSLAEVGAHRTGIVIALTSVLALGSACASEPAADTAAVATVTATLTAFATPSQSSTPTASPTRTPTPTPTTKAVRKPSLVGNRHNAWAFAPLSDPSKITVEGSVPSSKAYSTSKVPIIAAFIATVGQGDPSRLSSRQRGWIEKALATSDGAAMSQIQNAIPGGPATAVTKIFRAIGDKTTTGRNTLTGTMQWSVREQVRFMAALNGGKVVNEKTSAYILARMHPVKSQSWGLGSVGASAFKGGWYSSSRETRQMGIVDGYAVAIITDGTIGPVILQSDGDSAHVAQLNKLAARLHQRLR